MALHEADNTKAIERFLTLSMGMNRNDPNFHRTVGILLSFLRYLKV
jgi:hypothetical protein